MWIVVIYSSFWIAILVDQVIVHMKSLQSTPSPHNKSGLNMPLMIVDACLIEGHCCNQHFSAMIITNVLVNLSMGRRVWDTYGLFQVHSIPCLYHLYSYHFVLCDLHCLLYLLCYCTILFKYVIKHTWVEIWTLHCWPSDLWYFNTVRVMWSNILTHWLFSSTCDLCYCTYIPGDPSKITFLFFISCPSVLMKYPFMSSPQVPNTNNNPCPTYNPQLIVSHPFFVSILFDIWQLTRSSLNAFISE